MLLETVALMQICIKATVRSRRVPLSPDTPNATRRRGKTQKLARGPASGSAGGPCQGPFRSVVAEGQGVPDTDGLAGALGEALADALGDVLGDRLAGALGDALTDGLAEGAGIGVA